MKGKKSCGIAKDRLRQLILTDRIGCSDQLLIMLQNDMASAISRYLEVDKSRIEFCFRRDLNRFEASVPISSIAGRHFS